MVAKKTLKRIAKKATVRNQYKKQLIRVKKDGKQTGQIKAAVDEAIVKLPKAAKGSLVI